MDDEEITKRKLIKLPNFALDNADDTPYTEGVGEEDEEDDMDLLLARANTEEDIAQAHRLLHERREERIQKESMSMNIDTEPPKEERKPEPLIEDSAMEVDGEVDPLDAFMAGLDNSGSVHGRAVPSSEQMSKKQAPEPEAYFSDDGDYNYESGKVDPSSILAMAAKKKKKDIPVVDYSKLDMNPSRTNYWVDPLELSQMTDEEAASLR